MTEGKRRLLTFPENFSHDNFKWLYKRRGKIKHKYLTGEDIDMFNERTYSNRKNICDNHWDGA